MIEQHLQLWELLAFLLCWVVIGLFVWLIYAHRQILMGFTLMAALSFAVMNVSALFVTILFGLDDSFMTPARVLVAFHTLGGLIAFVVGVWIAWRPIRLGNHLINPYMQHSHLVWVFLIIGGLATVFSAALSQVTTFGAVLARMSTLIQLGMLAAVAQAHERKGYTKLLIAAVIYFCFAIVFTLKTGFAGLLGMVLLQIAIMLIFRPPITPLKFFSFALVVYLFFGASGIWLQTRAIIREGNLKSSSIIGGAIEFSGVMGFAISDSFMTEAPFLSPRSIQQAVVQRVDLSQYNAAQVEWMPRGEPYALGSSLFFDPLRAIIPRVIWPGKDITLGDSEFVNRFTGMNLASSEIAVDTNMTFEFYANFGWPGVVIGMGIFGWVIGTLEVLVFRPKLSLPGLFLASMILLSLAGGGSRAAALALQGGCSVIAALLFGWILPIVTPKHQSTSQEKPEERGPPHDGLPPPRRLTGRRHHNSPR